MSERKQRGAAISWMERYEDGPVFGYDSAKVKCPECDGWDGVVCPHGCGVRLISTQAEENARLMAELRERDAERKRRRSNP